MIVDLISEYRLFLEGIGLSEHIARMLENFTVLVLIAFLAFLAHKELTAPSVFWLVGFLQ